VDDVAECAAPGPARAVGQAHVGQAQVERIALQQRLGFAEVASTEGVEFHPSQGDFQEFADIRLVVDDEDFAVGSCSTLFPSVSKGDAKAAAALAWFEV
jgi:hypothetical protein